MSSVTLSTGEQVNLKDFVPHKAETAFWDAIRALKKAEEAVTVFLYNRGLEAMLPHLITSVVKDGQSFQPDAKWIGDLIEKDYKLLEEAAGKIRAAAEQAIDNVEKKG
jgi:hypothetical protein